MSAWDEGYLDEEFQGYSAFDGGPEGEFQFSSVQGNMDGQLTTH